MSRKNTSGPWGREPYRIFRTNGDPSVRRFEDDECEDERQAELGPANLRADGKHYSNPRAIVSVEDGERDAERLGLGNDTSGGFKALMQMAWASVWHMGMYSEDPNIARMAIVHTVQEQVGVQRQMSAQNQQMLAQQHAQERAEDEAREDARMQRMAQILVAEVRRTA